MADPELLGVSVALEDPPELQGVSLALEDPPELQGLSLRLTELDEGTTGFTEAFDAWVGGTTEGLTGATESFDAWIAGLFEGATGQTESFDLWDFIQAGVIDGTLSLPSQQIGFSDDPLELRDQIGI